MNKYITISALTLSLIATTPLNQEASASMKSFFKNQGIVYNYSPGQAYESQSYGHYVGGSLYARMPVEEYQLANVRGPRLKAGCHNADLFMGSMQFLKKDEFVNALRNISNNAAGYAFNLALQTFVPQIYNIIQKLNDIAREINNMVINSCEVGQGLVQNAWGKSDTASATICQDIGVSEGWLADRASAKHECGARREEMLGKAKKHPDFQDQLGAEFNLVWKALKKRGITSNKSLAESFMTISGTVLGKKEGSGKDMSLKLTAKPAKGIDIKYINAIMQGGGDNKSKAYKCKSTSLTGDDECLEVEEVPIKDNEPLVPHVRKLLQSMTDKLVANKALSEDEKAITEMTRIPVLKILTIELAVGQGAGSALNIEEYAEGIAYDIILNYFSQIFQLVHDSVSKIEQVQTNSEIITKFKKELEEARKLIATEKYTVYKKIDTVLGAIQKTALQERQMQSNFSDYVGLKNE